MLGRAQETDPEIETTVRAIIQAVRTQGDAALLAFGRQFEDPDLAHAEQLEVPRARLDAACAGLPKAQRAALEAAAERIRRYHERQLQHTWTYEEAGVMLGQQVTALDRVGVYVPGGKAAYPSSVLMNAIPARIAGVAEIVMVVPAPRGVLDDVVLAAAAIAGVDRVFRIGGAQAIAALAYGTATLPRVDKIVGPGNIYVATAKRMVFGQVAIDMIAGPSEIVIVADGATDPAWIAMDLFSQAEHDERAQAILIAPDATYLDQVEQAAETLLPSLERAAIIRTAAHDAGALIAVSSLDEAMELVNRIAPEHLELSLADASSWLPRIRHAGAIFLGRHTAEAVGDYCAGPNHVLPTAGTARFSSPLGVYDFQKRTSLIACSAEAADTLGRTASVLARAEGLTAHARSAEYRIGKTKRP
ncbi:MAG TPA: histidinol dehydrogenase [Acidiferrobacteraceae bacterium]|nr:histidinol dehydrogenase [Acidiferrobacteraceae bacterium]